MAIRWRKIDFYTIYTDKWCAFHHAMPRPVLVFFQNPSISWTKIIRRDLKRQFDNIIVIIELFFLIYFTLK